MGQEVCGELQKLKTRPIKIENVWMKSLRVEFPKFNGKISWSTYRIQFEATAQGNRWNDDDHPSFVTAIHGLVLDVLQGILKYQ